MVNLEGCSHEGGGEVQEIVACFIILVRSGGDGVVRLIRVRVWGVCY